MMRTQGIVRAAPVELPTKWSAADGQRPPAKLLMNVDASCDALWSRDSPSPLGNRVKRHQPASWSSDGGVIQLIWGFRQARLFRHWLSWSEREELATL